MRKATNSSNISNQKAVSSLEEGFLLTDIHSYAHTHSFTWAKKSIRKDNKYYNSKLFSNKLWKEMNKIKNITRNKVKCIVLVSSITSCGRQPLSLHLHRTIANQSTVSATVIPKLNLNLKTFIFWHPQPLRWFLTDLSSTANYLCCDSTDSTEVSCEIFSEFLKENLVCLHDST